MYVDITPDLYEIERLLSIDPQLKKGFFKSCFKNMRVKKTKMKILKKIKIMTAK